MDTVAFSDQVSFTMDIAWSDRFDTHTDQYHVNQMNCWRDLEADNFLTLALEKARQSQDGTVTCRVAPGELVPPWDPAKQISLPRSRFQPMPAFDTLVPGRFYPQGLITGLPGVFKGNTTPFRCLEKNDRAAFPGGHLRKISKTACCVNSQLSRISENCC